MSLKEMLLIGGAFSGLLPVGAAYLRHRSGMAWLSTFLAAAGLSAVLALLARLVHVGPGPDAVPWIFTLVGVACPALLGGYLLSATMGREDPRASVHSVRRTLLGLGLAGAIFLVFLRHPAFVTGYDPGTGGGRIQLGSLGKAYLSYLLVGIIFIGYNLENTYRLGSGAARERLRPAVLGIFGVLGFFTYVLTSGLLYSAVELDPLVASLVPVMLANVLVGYGFIRGALVDAAVPVSRNVVYSSFTGFVAALYVLTVGIIAQLATYTRWSPGQVVSVSLGFLLIVTTVTLILSPRLQRRVRRFIDRNFYVHRYDYRSQWFRTTRSLDPSLGLDGVLECARDMMREVFRADDVTLALVDSSSGNIVPRVGMGAEKPGLTLEVDSPLHRKLKLERRALMLDGNPEDFEFIPIYVENREWLDGTGSQAVAPLLVGQDLLGVVGLRRRHPEDGFTFEDLDLLDSMSAQVAAVLRAVQLAEELADAREMELLAQWSSMLLHDLKNNLSPLRMIVTNMRVHMDNKEFLHEAMDDLGSVANRLEQLVRRLGELKAGPQLNLTRTDVNLVVQNTVSSLKLEHRADVETTFDLQAKHEVVADGAMLQRVIENLVTNALDAMDGQGSLTIRTFDDKSGGRRSCILAVEDTGCGMDDAYMRTRLFKPFATTKSRGLGLGLYQCRSIVRAHEGDLKVKSRQGKGTRFEVVLPAASSVSSPSTHGDARPAATGSAGRQP